MNTVNNHNLYYSTGQVNKPVSVIASNSRVDGWESLARDVNSGRSITQAVKYEFTTGYDDYTLDNMYIHDEMFAKIIDVFPDEATKKPLVFKDIDENKETNNEAQIKAIESFIDENNLYITLNRAMKLNRKNGACLIVFIFSNDEVKSRNTDDANRRLKEHLAKPLKLSNKDRLVKVIIYEKKDITDKIKDDSGQWQYFTVNTKSGSTTYHASRCVFFNGYYKGEEAERINNDFGYGIASDGLLSAIRNYETFVSMIPDYLDDAVMTVTKMQGLKEIMVTSGDNPNLYSDLLKLFDIQSLVKSRLKTRLVDEYDDVTRQELTNLDKMVKLFEVSINDLVAKSKVPATKLLGISPSGSIGSQSGMYEQQEFYDSVKSEMVLYCVPYWNKVLEIAGYLLGITNRKFKKIKYELPALKEQTEQEKAETKKLKSEHERIEQETIRLAIENKQRMMELGLTVVDDKVYSYLELGMTNPYESIMNTSSEHNQSNTKTSAAKTKKSNDTEMINKANDNNMNSIENANKKPVNVGLSEVKK